MINTPKPPYYAVIFTNEKTSDTKGYAEMADQMAMLAAEQPGYLGLESISEGDKTITISYWTDQESILNWKNISEHVIAQKTGRERWYNYYTTRVAKVERDYSFDKEDM